MARVLIGIFVLLSWIHYDFPSSLWGQYCILWEQVFQWFSLKLFIFTPCGGRIHSFLSFILINVYNILLLNCIMILSKHIIVEHWTVESNSILKCTVLNIWISDGTIFVYCVHFIVPFRRLFGWKSYPVVWIFLFMMD